MTVKLAKFFNSSSNDTPPPLPPPPKPMSNNNATHNHQEQQQQTYNYQLQHQGQEHQTQKMFNIQQINNYNPYYDDDDDDNMSMYSTATSIMTTRDHPFNNSQRPLLPARKPTTQLIHKKKLNGNVNLNANAKATAPHHQFQLHHNQQHKQPQHAPQQEQKSYISPYVQQQKRDSAKGLHGFNDFDILSQQYNQHLQSPHIGYPYGSPPSPTANSTDFVFDTLTTTMSTTVTAKPTKQPRYANINNFTTSSTTPTNSYHKVMNTIDYYNQSVGAKTYYNHNHNTGSPSQQDYMGKSSRFEDDFCCRRNDVFARQQLDAQSRGSASSNSCSSSGGGSGPFIFGLPPDQQTDLINCMPSNNNGRRFFESTDTVISSNKDYERDNYSATVTLSGKSTMQQSTSDTSSSTQDSSPSDVSGNSKKGAKFLLLRRSKSKKKSKKDKKSEAESTKQSTEPQKPTIKCVLVGDGAVGKTNLILSYLENRFNPEHVPTASDIYNADVMVNDNPVHLTLCDTAGQDTLDPLRELCYPDSDVFLLCFSVAKPETFDAIKTKWAPKFAKSKAALVLVGTQADLRTNSNVLNKLQTNGEKPISYADAWDLATSIGAKYIETSSATQDKVKEVFDTAIWDGLLPNTLPPTPPFWKKWFCLA